MLPARSSVALAGGWLTVTTVCPEPAAPSLSVTVTVAVVAPVGGGRRGGAPAGCGWPARHPPAVGHAGPGGAGGGRCRGGRGRCPRCRRRAPPRPPWVDGCPPRPPPVSWPIRRRRPCRSR